MPRAERFVPEQRKLHAIDSLPLEEGAALMLSKLPDYHRDPFDRMLVAQAMDEGLTLVTGDGALGPYAVPQLRV